MEDKKKRRYDTVIFDLDGTLLDTLGDLTDSTNAVLEQYGMPGHTQEQIRSFVGNGIRRLLECAVPGGTSSEQLDLVYRSFRAYYDIHCMDRTKPYPGILSLLGTLKEEGYRIAIVSNKADFAVKKLNQIYFSDLISVAVGEREQIRRKPAPDSVFWAMKELWKLSEDAVLSCEDKARTVYIGDSEVDIQTAQNAGLDCVAVSWGFRTREDLICHGALERRIAANTEELKNLLEERE